MTLFIRLYDIDEVLSILESLKNMLDLHYLYVACQWCNLYTRVGGVENAVVVLEEDVTENGEIHASRTESSNVLKTMAILYLVFIATRAHYKYMCLPFPDTAQTPSQRMEQ